MKRWLLLGLCLLALPALAGSLQISDGYVREMPPGQMTTAAFMKIVNTSADAVALIAADSTSAQTVELHTHRRVNGMLVMERVRRLEIPAHGQVQLAPGGYHLMLINLKRTLHAGDRVSITLFDERGRTYAATLPVVKMLGASGTGH